MYLFVEKVYGICGHVDILVNNGGVTHRGSILNTKTDVDQKIMFINYFGSVALTKGMYSFDKTCNFNVFTITNLFISNQFKLNR